MKTALKLDVRGNIYDINYPNTGQQIDMELLKAKIADGNYDALRFSNNILFQHQADVIDMIATFSVLVPQLKTDLNVKTFFDLEEEATQELLVVYTEQFTPWYVALKKAIKNPKQQVESKDITNRDFLSKDEIENESKE